MAFCKEMKKLKILLVDEDAQFTEKLASFLEMENLECTTSNDPGIGLLSMLENEFDIVVLDLDMLVSLGTDIIEFLATVRRLNCQKLILTTNFPSATILATSMLKNEIDSFVSKALKIETLCEIIKGQNDTSARPGNAFFVN